MLHRFGSAILIAIFFLIPAGIYLYMGSSSLPKLPADEELTPVTGPARDVVEEDHRSEESAPQPSRWVTFTINGQRLFYEDGAKFDDVVGAVKSGTVVNAWFRSADTKSFHSGPGYSKLYKLTAGNQPILSYDDLLSREVSNRKFSKLYGVVVLIISLAVFANALFR